MSTSTNSHEDESLYLRNKDAGKSISDFYRDRTVFITGASGFMGKVLVEKLLRCCPGVRCVYLLIRPRKSQDAKARLQDLLTSKVWDRVRQECPSVLSKLIALEGDITLPGLGLNEQDTSTLARDVSVVFHVAATVRFNEPLRVAVTFNLGGTKRVSELARKMRNLQAFVHMSTAYSNCNRKEIDELVYTSNIRPQDITSLLEWVDDETLRDISPKLIRDHPNTYTYTKLLAENYLAEFCKDLPLTIVRPAIVTAAWKEPFPGWVDNTYGPSGLFAAVRKGMLRTTLVRSRVSVEVTPVDMAANLVLVAACLNNTNHSSSSPLVLNLVSGPVNNLRIDVLYSNALPRLLRPKAVGSGTESGKGGKSIRKPSYQPSLGTKAYAFRCLVDHYLPAAVVDVASLFRGKKPRMLSACRRLHGVLEGYMYFTLNEWSFRCDQVQKLLKGLSPEDQKIFGFDLKCIDWPSYMEAFAEGVCKYVLSEDEGGATGGADASKKQNGAVAEHRDSFSTLKRSCAKNFKSAKISLKAMFGIVSLFLLILKSCKLLKYIFAIIMRHISLI